MAKRKRKATKRKPNVDITAIDTVLPTPEQIMKGEAVRDFVTHAETATKAMAHKVTHDPVKRWERDGKLSSVEIQTIERMQDAWQAVYGEVSVTGSYSEPLGAQTRAVRCDTPQERIIALREALCAAEAVFEGPAKVYYLQFERICRFGEAPLDVSGNRDKALNIVCFVANMIAAKNIV